MASPTSRASRHLPDAQPSNSEDALTHSDSTSPLPQLRSRRWRTASSGEELWSEFEARRRSAEDYLNLYYECMDTISTDLVSFDYGTVADTAFNRQVQEAPPDGQSNGDMVRLKIYRDTILRELIIMEDIALYVQQAYVSIDEPVMAPKTTIWTIGCCLTAALNSSAVIIAASAAGAVAGGVALLAPPAWRAFHKKQIQDNIASLRNLKKTVAEGLDPTAHRNSLRASRFSSLERVTENLTLESGRVVEEL